MVTTGPCDICIKLGKELGMPCRPMSCPCKCHAKSKARIKAETDKITGANNEKIVAQIKAGHGLAGGFRKGSAPKIPTHLQRFVPRTKSQKLGYL